MCLKGRKKFPDLQPHHGGARAPGDLRREKNQEPRRRRGGGSRPVGAMSLSSTPEARFLGAHRVSSAGRTLTTSGRWRVICSCLTTGAADALKSSKIQQLQNSICFGYSDRPCCRRKSTASCRSRKGEISDTSSTPSIAPNSTSTTPPPRQGRYFVPTFHHTT